ncbi:mechanosensitive ion channel family protein [Adhaeribacter radiodurans]|uniref:Mechanosensitive ion channel n=1 Tax=Adhaeribacter radiodurans TaxID=2745197 RepID=A0A7L7L8N5_9BACT|nr:mechanosensitive ion channel domain-containing protein [Adhaeribacter radiodurans]QMU29190.1 mechanosensitive ion channel [Adhaeribacter radiodurans]
MNGLFDFNKYRETLTTFFITYGARFFVAMLLLFIGLWVLNRIVKFLDREMIVHHVDPSLRPFLRNVLNVSLKILLLIAVVGQLGMEMTSIFAVLGSAGLAIGLALQGSLANFAGGVLILALKPFRVGDYIEAQGVAGNVNLINILNTVIKTSDNKTIYIPNGPLASSTIVNFDVESNRRADVRILVHYGNNIILAKELITQIISADSRILTQPAPQVVTENTDLGVNIFTRVWAARGNVGGITNDLHDWIRTAFEKNGISIAYREPALPGK